MRSTQTHTGWVVVAKLWRRVRFPLVAFLGAACVYIGQGALARNAPAPGAAQSIPASTATVADAAGRIRQNIDRYLRSIDAADADLANGLWLQSPEASFIHPLGEERGWQQIKDHFYGTLMGKMLSQRELKLVGDPQIQIFGCAAVAQFNWNLSPPVETRATRFTP